MAYVLLQTVLYALIADFFVQLATAYITITS